MRARKVIAITAALVLVAACGRDRSVPIAEHLKNKQAAVFVFLATDCSLSQSYTRTLNDLRAQFQASGIEFYAVFTGDAVVEDFVATYKIAFPVLHDRDYRLTDFFGATKTPEAF